MSHWNELDFELRRWNELGEKPSLWWRDDDAVEDSESLRRLNALSVDNAIPLSLAVIPYGAKASLLNLFKVNKQLFALQHGFSHNNYAAPTERKLELGNHRPLGFIVEELKLGTAQLQSLLVERFFPVLVPPWNRVSDELLVLLKREGFTGISTLGPRSGVKKYGMTQINVHVDLFDWKKREFAGEKRVLSQLISHLIAKRESQVDSAEPTGIMTHHLVHDENCWEFLQELFDHCDDSKVVWESPKQLFTNPD